MFCEFKKYLPVAPWSAAGQRPGMSHAARSPAPQDPPAARPGAGDPAMAAAPAHAPSVTKEIEHQGFFCLFWEKESGHFGNFYRLKCPIWEFLYR